MFEREEGQERSIEEILTLLKEKIQPVMDGRIKEMTILAEVFDPMTGRKDIHFFLVDGVFGERGRRIFEKLRREMEYAPNYDFWMETGEFDYYHYEQRWCVPTKYEDVSLVRREIYEKFKEPQEPERIEWSIVNQQHKPLAKRLKEKAVNLIFGEGQRVEF